MMYCLQIYCTFNDVSIKNGGEKRVHATRDYITAECGHFSSYMSSFHFHSQFYQGKWRKIYGRSESIPLIDISSALALTCPIAGDLVLIIRPVHNIVH